MCITSGPAILSKSLPSAIVNFSKKTHVKIYANTAKNISGIPNCMPLPIPGRFVQGYDTRSYKDFLQKIAEATEPRTRGGLSKGGDFDRGISIVNVGSYTIVIAEDASVSSIFDALATLPEEKRPTMSKSLIDWYVKKHPGKTIAFCCFSGNEEFEAEPIMLEYIPTDFDTVWFDGADGHDGDVPMSGLVDRDQTLLVGFYGHDNKNLTNSNLNGISWDKKTPKFIRDADWHRVGKFGGSGNNCDWTFKISDVIKDSWGDTNFRLKEELV